MTLNVHRRSDRKHTRKVRVWLDGVEVTNRCFYADGRRGVVRLYALDPRGRKFVAHDGNRVATEELRGRVRWGRIA